MSTQTLARSATVSYVLEGGDKAMQIQFEGNCQRQLNRALHHAGYSSRSFKVKLLRTSASQHDQGLHVARQLAADQWVQMQYQGRDAPRLHFNVAPPPETRGADFLVKLFEGIRKATSEDMGGPSAAAADTTGPADKQEVRELFVHLAKNRVILSDGTVAKYGLQQVMVVELSMTADGADRFVERLVRNRDFRQHDNPKLLKVGDDWKDYVPDKSGASGSAGRDEDDADSSNDRGDHEEDLDADTGDGEDNRNDPHQPAGETGAEETDMDTRTNPSGAAPIQAPPVKPPEPPKSLTERVKAFRTKYVMTIDAMAEHCDCSPPSLKKVESGENIKEIVAKRIESALLRQPGVNGAIFQFDATTERLIKVIIEQAAADNDLDGLAEQVVESWMKTSQADEAKAAVIDMFRRFLRAQSDDSRLDTLLSMRDAMRPVRR